MLTLPPFAFRIAATLAVVVVFVLPTEAQKPKILKNLNVTIKRLDQLNSKYEETNICITPNGNTMFFMSDRGGQPWSEPQINANRIRYDGDIWRSVKQGDSWSSPRVMLPPISTKDGEDEPNVLADGKTVIFQSWQDGWELRGGPYFASTMQGSRWSTPRGLGGGITRFFKEKFEIHRAYGTDGVAVSPDGNTFVMAAGADYYGNMDLYISKRGPTGEWSYPRKLSLSTPRNERSAFFGSDGKTLYFSSNGHGGYGGLDIFKTTLNPDGSHGEIINLGPEFNTLKNDYGFIIAAHGEEAYFVRNGDIYQAIIKDPPPELLGEQSGMILGHVRNHDGTPMQCTMKLVNAKTGQALQIMQTDASTGEYSFFVANRSVPVKVECYTHKDRWGHKTARFTGNKQYEEVVVNFNKPTPEPEPTAAAETRPREPDNAPKPAALKKTDSPEAPLPAEPAEKVVVDNDVVEYVFFSYNSAELPPAARFKLNRIAREMKAQPKLRYLLAAFGDHRGTWEYNARLSRERAINVAKYLVGAGVRERQLVVEYYPMGWHENHGNKSLYQGIRKVEICKMVAEPNPETHNVVDLAELNIEVTGIRGVSEGKEMVRFRRLGEQIAAEPNEPAHYIERGLLHAKHHDYDAALHDFDKARELGATAKTAAVHSAFVQEALEALNTVLEVNKDEPHALMLRGELYDFTGKKEAACKDWKRVQALDPSLLKNHQQVLCK